jgi:acetyl-CoA acetyltransferase
LTPRLLPFDIDWSVKEVERLAKKRRERLCGAMFGRTDDELAALLEAHGFARPGEARDFIKSGQLRIDGMLPTNPNGGLLGEGYIHDYNNMTEAVRQMRGTAANQVKGAQTAFVSSGRNAFILGRE